MSQQRDIQLTLKKLEFPACAKEALHCIESMIVSRSKKIAVMQQIISEFIFREQLDKNSESTSGARQEVATMPTMSNLSALNQFELVMVLVQFFSQPGPDATRNAVFISIFGNLTEQRTQILCRLISTAVSGSVAPLLSAAGAWMQQVGCTAAPSPIVAQALVSDFILYSLNTPDQIKHLPLVASHFCTNLMTAVADLYLNDKHAELKPPPDGLLDLITEWVTENRTLCLTSAQEHVALPSGAIAMPVERPFAGLIRWTVLAPIVSQREAYSDMHLSLLQALMEFKGNGLPTELNAQHLMAIASALQNYCGFKNESNRTSSKMETEGNPIKPTTSNRSVSDAAYEKCIERLAQAVQVALQTNCVYGNIPALLCCLEKLKRHPLMDIVIRFNKRISQETI